MVQRLRLRPQKTMLNMKLALAILAYVATCSNPVDAVPERTLELQLSVAVGGNVTLPCSTTADTSVDWRYHFSPLEQPSMVYSNHLVYEGYRDRFNVTRHTPGDYGLMISRAVVDDKGIYTCIEDGGYGKKHTISLMVADSPPVEECSSGINGAVIGLAIGLVVLFVIAAFEAVYIILCVCCRRKDEKLVPDVVRLQCHDEQPLLAPPPITVVSSSHLDESRSADVTVENDPDLSATDSQLASLSTSTRKLKRTLDDNSNQTTKYISGDDQVTGVSVAHPSDQVDNPKQEDSPTTDHVTGVSVAHPSDKIDNPKQADSPPTTLPVIAFNKSAPIGNQVHGVCVVDDKLYVARSKQSVIDFYDIHTMTRIGGLAVTGDGSDWPGCMVFDSVRQLFFISYYQAKLIRRIRPADGDCKAWSVKGQPDGVAVTSRGVLVAFRNEGKLGEFEPDGKSIREIHLDNRVNQPRHAIPYGNDEFLVCFGFAGGACGMCLVNGKGAVVKFVDPKTEHPLHVEIGRNNSVFVAGFTGDSVTMLDSRLEYVMDAIPKGVVHEPFRLYVDRDCQKLYVGDYKGGCRVFDISYK